MAKHRTKKDRIKAAQRRQEKRQAEPKKVVKIEKVSKETDDSIAKLFAYDPKLIFKDLKKTFFLVFLILVVLLGLALIYT